MRLIQITGVKNRRITKFLILFGIIYFAVICPIYFNGQWSSRTKKDVDFTIRWNVEQDVKPMYIFGFENELDLKEDGFKIPHIIHQTAKNETLPILIKPWMMTWLQLHLKWQHWFWTDADIRKFISTRYPDFLPVFDSYEMDVARADVFRYFALYEFGGVYADTDIECLKPLDANIAEHQCILSQEPYLHAFFHYNQRKIVANSFMACRPRHPFYKFVINQLQYYAGFNNVIFATGPKLIDSVYDTFMSQNVNKFEESLHLAEPDAYQPMIDPRKPETYKRLCMLQDRKKKDMAHKMKICQKLLSGSFTNEPKNTSMTAHHWTHMWKPKYRDDIKFGIRQKIGTFHIQNLFL